MRRRRAQSGFTLIEILVVLCIVGVLGALSVRGLRSLARSDLRASVSHLSGAIRYLFDRASTTGQYHRLVIDIESGRYWAEVSDDMFYLLRVSVLVLFVFLLVVLVVVLVVLVV